MSTKTERPSARPAARRYFWALARALALVWLLPAVVFNLDWTHGFWTAHNIGGIGMVLGSAVLMHIAVHRPHWFMSPALVLVVLCTMLLANTQTAWRNLSTASEGASEAKSKEITRASHLASQRSQLDERINTQVQLVGWTSVGALEAALARVIASEPKQWSISSQCEAPNGPITGSFCTRVADAKGEDRSGAGAGCQRRRLRGPAGPAAIAVNARPSPTLHGPTSMAILTRLGCRPSRASW